MGQRLFMAGNGRMGRNRPCDAFVVDRHQKKGPLRVSAARTEPAMVYDYFNGVVFLDAGLYVWSMERDHLLCKVLVEWILTSRGVIWRSADGKC